MRQDDCPASRRPRCQRYRRAAAAQGFEGRCRREATISSVGGDGVLLRQHLERGNLAALPRLVAPELARHQSGYRRRHPYRRRAHSGTARGIAARERLRPCVPFPRVPPIRPGLAMHGSAASRGSPKPGSAERDPERRLRRRHKPPARRGSRRWLPVSRGCAGLRVTHGFSGSRANYRLIDGVLRHVPIGRPFAARHREQAGRIDVNGVVA